jgi:hypothetical protein
VFALHTNVRYTNIARRASAIQGEQMEYRTVFASLGDYRKGAIEVIDDDPAHYAFSNVFEVASAARPYEKVAVGKNMQYVLEVVRAEGTSEWRSCDHDETVLCMDGEVAVELVDLVHPVAPAGKDGSVRLEGEPEGPRMGRIVLRRGHMALLPRASAYRFAAAAPAVLVQQTCLGDDTVERWAEICLR